MTKDGRGWAVFANQDIPVGTLILREPPMISEYHYGVDHDLSSIDQVKLWSLRHNHTLPTKKERLDNLMCINAQSGPAKSSGVYLYFLGSHFNHHCLPNCNSTINSQEELLIQTIKDIKQGEELNFSYISEHWATRSLRQQVIKGVFMFECQCSVCTDEDPLYDKYRTTISNFLIEISKCFTCLGPRKIEDLTIPAETIWQEHKSLILLANLIYEGTTIETCSADIRTKYPYNPYRYNILLYSYFRFYYRKIKASDPEIEHFYSLIKEELMELAIKLEDGDVERVEKLLNYWG